MNVGMKVRILSLYMLIIGALFIYDPSVYAAEAAETPMMFFQEEGEPEAPDKAATRPETGTEGLSTPPYELLGYPVPLTDEGAVDDWDSGEEPLCDLDSASLRTGDYPIVYDRMIALKEKYPEGTPWTNQNYYQ